MANGSDGGNGDLPVPTEDYQKKLYDFLADVPPLNGKDEGPEIVSGTPALKSAPGAPITDERINAIASSIKSDPLFLKYTGYDHKRLLGKWKNDRTTTCNDFITKCVAAMGYKGQQGIGRFDIADQLSIHGLSHAWVPADSGSTPEYGDPYRLLGDIPDHNGTRLNHMAITLYVNGTDWFTVEAGQGGPSKGVDSLRRRKRTWKDPALRGWVSMRAMMNASKPLPYWLGGWWQVQESGRDTPYYYYFDANGKVSYTSTAPASFLVPPTYAPLVGTFGGKRFHQIEISWNSEDVNETFTVTENQDDRKYTFIGKTDSGTTLTAQRLMLKYAAD
jgi:hypothetical protein